MGYCFLSHRSPSKYLLEILENADVIFQASVSPAMFQWVAATRTPDMHNNHLNMFPYIFPIFSPNLPHGFHIWIHHIRQGALRPVPGAATLGLARTSGAAPAWRRCDGARRPWRSCRRRWRCVPRWWGPSSTWQAWWVSLEGRDSHPSNVNPGLINPWAV